MSKRDAIEDIYPLSPMQEGMFFHYQMNRESTVYIEQEDMHIRGTIDIRLLEKSFNVLIAHHGILRTLFTSKKLKKPQQVIMKERSAGIHYEDISGLEENAKARRIEDFKEEDVKRRFNLSKDIPMRISVIRTSADAYRLLLTFHHIILDGWSVGLLYKDLLKTYRSLREGKTVQLEPVKEYRHYIKWLEKQDVEKGLRYWRDYLGGYENPVSLPGIYSTPPDGQFRRCSYDLLIDEELTERLTHFSRENHVTLNTIFQVLWAILLKRYNNTDDVLFGTIVSGRPMEIQGISRMVGLFINNVPFRVHLDEKSRFFQLVGIVQEKELEAKSYHYLPLPRIQDQSTLKRSLINHIMVFENFPIQDEVRRIGIDDIGFGVEELNSWGHTNYNFVLLAAAGKTVTVKLKYNALVYPDHLIEHVGNHFRELIVRVVEDPGVYIGELGKAGIKRQAEILAHFNRDLKKEAAPLLQRHDTLQGQLEEMFQKYKNNTAAAYGSRTLSYAELEKKSAAIAHRITGSGIEKETFIGILLEDRVDVITSIIGILRARCVFVPLYSSYPAERIETMIASTGMKYIIMDETNFNRFDKGDSLSGGDITVLFLQDLSNYPANTAMVRYSPEDKIYLYFTSGTTGTPKAVVGKNSGLLHFINWEIDTFHITSRDRTSQFTIPTFDPYLRDIFVPLLSGGTICIPPDNETLLDADTLVHWINHNRISLIHCVTGLFRLINSVSLTAEDFPALRFIALGGEKTNPSDLVSWYETFGERIQPVNFYGPTETTLVKVHHFIRESDVKRERIPIGIPIKGARVIILDEKMNLCDTLEAGEICIRTPYRSFGYHNDRESNEKKFIVNPFNNDPGDIIYKSGDLGRILPDGTIDILGRIDRQVKIRGHRVELEEIERVLIGFPLVKEAAVIKKERSNNIETLEAFIVKANDKETTTADIKAYLSMKLPDYMVPANITEIETMPKKANGKRDFMKLHELSRDEFSDDTGDDEPRDLIEKRLSELWSEILGIENKKISPTRLFFEIGGSSLHMMSLSSRIHKEFDVKIPLPELFNHPSIRRQALTIRSSMRDESYKSIKRVEELEFYPLTSPQRRIYMVQQLKPESTVYNLPHSFVLEGSVDTRRLEETFKTLIQRHESLRTSFELVDGEPRQRIHNTVDFEVKNSQPQPGGFVKPFDLSRAPLLRVELSKQGHKENKYILAIDVHHIVTDGVSLGILIKEFTALYEGRPLPALNLQYRDYSQWQNGLEREKLRKNQESYWLREFNDFKQMKPLSLRPDYERPPVMSFEGSTLVFEIEKEKMEALARLALEKGATLFSILFAVYIIMLAKISGQNDFVVGTLAAGRGHADLENMIGMFVNTLALRCKYDGEKTFTQFLEALNKKVLEAFENQDYPFEDLVREVVDGRDQSRNPLFDTMFVLQNLGLQELQLPGLKLLPFEVENHVSKFDLSLKCVEAGDNYHFHLEYRTKLFKREKIERYADDFKQIVTAVVENSGIKPGEIEMDHEFSPIEVSKVNVDFDF